MSQCYRLLNLYKYYITLNFKLQHLSADIFCIFIELLSTAKRLPPFYAFCRH